MLRILWILLLAAAAWYGWGKYQDHARAQREAEIARKPAKQAPAPARSDAAPSFFTCDGRTQCKQMTSCEEAKYFVKNCPGMTAQVSGEDVRSCEQQWCR